MCCCCLVSDSAMPEPGPPAATGTAAGASHQNICGQAGGVQHGLGVRLRRRQQAMVQGGSSMSANGWVHDPVFHNPTLLALSAADAPSICRRLNSSRCFWSKAGVTANSEVTTPSRARQRTGIARRPIAQLGQNGWLFSQPTMHSPQKQQPHERTRLLATGPSHSRHLTNADSTSGNAAEAPCEAAELFPAGLSGASRSLIVSGSAPARARAAGTPPPPPPWFPPRTPGACIRSRSYCTIKARFLVYLCVPTCGRPLG